MDELQRREKAAATERSQEEVARARLQVTHLSFQSKQFGITGAKAGACSVLRLNA